MASNPPQATAAPTLFSDGKLDENEALKALGDAASAATEALPKALAQCKTEQEQQAVVAERDVVVLAFLTALGKSLVHTSARFEQIAADLENAADNVRNSAKQLKNAVEAIKLFTELAKLASSLALAFA